MKEIEPKEPNELQFSEITYEKKEMVAKITINRPDRMNALSTKTAHEIKVAVDEAAFDDSVGVVVLTGAGSKAFCSGGDLIEYTEHYLLRPHDYWKYMKLFGAMMESIITCGKPVIARINGVAVAGGNELQLACDLAIMADHAFLAQAGVAVGSVAAGGSTQWLPLLVSDRRARQMLFLNDRIPAQKALDWGLVNDVVPYDKLDEKVDEMCKKLLEKFPECLRYTKEQVNFLKYLTWHLSIGHARDWLTVHKLSFEAHEGMSAFSEKRRVDYTGLRKKLAGKMSSDFRYGAPKNKCKSCGANYLPESFKFCGVCGAKIEE